MSDIAAHFSLDPLMEGYIGGDILQNDYDLETGDQLKTAVWMSLFSDRRALTDDRLPDFEGERRGWWGDSYADPDDAALESDRIGSRLWLLQRESLTAHTVERARQYAQESLSWLVSDGIAAKVDVQVQRVFSQGIHTLGAVIMIQLNNGEQMTFGFDDLWAQLKG